MSGTYEHDEVWVCPDCGGIVRAEGATERSPLRCDGCGARFRHPRLALLLSLALPGLGSLYQRRWLWGGVNFVAGSGTFVWTLWRLGFHLVDAWKTEPKIPAILEDAALGLGILMFVYSLDVLVVWLLRDRLQPL